MGPRTDIDRRGRRRRHELLALVLAVAVLTAACGDDDGDDDAATDDAGQTTEDRVASAELAVSESQTAFDEATAQFCADSEEYIVTIDRYGDIFNDDTATVGDVKAAGDDLVAPREQVQASADDALGPEFRSCRWFLGTRRRERAGHGVGGLLTAPIL